MEKEKLLLHACCAPCSSHCLTILCDKYDVTIFYSNDNMLSKKEFDDRLAELYKLRELNGLKFEIVFDPYDHKMFRAAIKGYEHNGEGSYRCYRCYKERLEKAVKYAVENNINLVTTTLTISPYKNVEWLNDLGELLCSRNNIHWLHSNFKENGGFEHSCKLADEYGLYQQSYCGCEFSYAETILSKEK